MSLIIGTIAFVAAASYITKHYMKPNSIYHDAPYKNILRAAILSSMAYDCPEDFKETIREFKNNKNANICKLDSTVNIMKELFTNLDLDLNDNQDIKFISKKFFDCQLYILNLNNDIYIVFRGTESVRDFLVDLDVRTHELDINSGCIHDGFYRQFNSVYPDIQKHIDSNQDKNNINISGHSLGGALSQICSYELMNKYPDKNIECYTFGSPRVGDQKFINNIKFKSWRVYNFEDPVPMVPMTKKFMHYNDNCLCLYNNKCDNSPRDYYWMLRPVTSMLLINFFSPISYHCVDNYINNLEDKIVI
jgi:hypothetical protein